jgi:2,4-dienoyl-CoA reductase-like NADH-dependent reductase (Old Yellow Enzyme family)
VTNAFTDMPLARGPVMSNRLMLAPMTNCQSRADGVLGDDEARWLLLRARGGFGAVMTCAAHVLREGQAFEGQLGIWSEEHVAGLRELTDGLRAAGSVSAIQLHHGGERASAELTGMPTVCPWENGQSGARMLGTGEVENVASAFVEAALRAQRAGFDGVELHAAHGYLLGQFLNAEHNRRSDGFGGSFAHRRRLLDLILAEVRRCAGPGFQIGVRLSPERYGLDTAEMIELAESLMASGAVDYLDLSLWDCWAEPKDVRFAGRSLLECFSGLERGSARLGVAGNLRSASEVQRCLDAGIDFALIGRAAILHHDFPRQIQLDPTFEARALPVSRDFLAREGVGQKFIDYLARWENFVV